MIDDVEVGVIPSVLCRLLVSCRLICLIFCRLGRGFVVWGADSGLFNLRSIFFLEAGVGWWIEITFNVPSSLVAIVWDFLLVIRNWPTASGSSSGHSSSAILSAEVFSVGSRST